MQGHYLNNQLSAISCSFCQEWKIPNLHSHYRKCQKIKGFSQEWMMHSTNSRKFRSFTRSFTRKPNSQVFSNSLYLK